MFLLYLPGSPQGDLTQKLRAAGLEAFAGDNVPTLEATEIIPPGQTGPDGGCGVLVRLKHGLNNPLDPPLVFRPDLQEWRPADPDPQRDLAGGRYWMGRARRAAGEAAPSAEPYCRRPRWHDAHAVTLLDRQPWNMPIPRGLPRWLQLDGQGQWKQCVKPEFQQYWDESEALFRAAVDGAPYKLEFALPYVLRGLALNYCLTPDLVSWLGLLDDSLVMECVAASLEAAQLREIFEAKKKREAALCSIADSPSPDAGLAAPAPSPTTSPPA